MLTGSSIYAGSPGPHLLQAVTLNRYSFPSITSVTVCSRSRIPVATCETSHRQSLKDSPSATLYLGHGVLASLGGGVVSVAL